MNETKGHEEEPLIEEGNVRHSTRTNRSFLRTSLAITAHLSLVLIYTAIFVYVTFIRLPVEKTTLYPIDNLRTQSIPKPYDDYIVSPFAGRPSPELDKAWHDLLAPTTIRVSEEELLRSNQSSVALPNGGYMAWLGVFHELHCIKMLRQWNYREHYHPEVVGDDAIHHIIHADHCLDVLRSAAICHADTTLTTFGWAENPTKPMLNTRQIDHKCVNWDALSASVEHRLVSEDEMAQMKNPNL